MKEKRPAALAGRFISQGMEPGLELTTIKSAYYRASNQTIWFEAVLNDDRRAAPKTRNSSTRRFRGSQQFFHPGDILGHVDADGIMFDLRDANLPAIFQPAQLLELLDTFQFALR